MAASRPLPTAPAVPCQQLWLLVGSENTAPLLHAHDQAASPSGDTGGQECLVAKHHEVISPELEPPPHSELSDMSQRKVHPSLCSAVKWGL
jgi:hypothetical protein